LLTRLIHTLIGVTASVTVTATNLTVVAAANTKLYEGVGLLGAVMSSSTPSVLKASSTVEGLAFELAKPAESAQLPGT